ncbi:MAG: alginate lyase family protein, partial [Planctomycetes bacterium]|nr:alginate lyase family protein [Planctomycetota bacterium]
YADRAAMLLRTWFLDPATKMNPHLQYGQAIPGRTQGRGIGIIDTAQLIYLVDAVALLQSSEVWSESDQQELQAWFRAYLQWLRTSSHGKAEARTKNNHAVWYDAQIVSFALFAGNKSMARETLVEVGPRRIASQIEPDGRMPYELARTKSFSYTHMNLRGFLHLARLGEHVDVDLWGYQSADGRSIEAALDWFEPFVDGREDWKWKQISPFTRSSATRLYRRAAKRFDKPEYHRLGSIKTDPTTDLLWPRP